MRERARGLERAQERALTPVWTGFYCFSGHITLRMVLIYYAQVYFGWLPFTENKGEDVANYIREDGYLQMLMEKWLKILSKHLLPQIRVREF